MFGVVYDKMSLVNITIKKKVYMFCTFKRKIIHRKMLQNQICNKPSSTAFFKWQVDNDKYISKADMILKKQNASKYLT